MALNASSPELASAETSGLGRWGRVFVAGMVLYSGARAVLVGETLGAYGVNPWVFLVLDVGSAIPLGIGQVRLVQALRRGDPAGLQRSLLVFGTAFLVPYLYLVLGGTRPLPVAAYGVIATVVAAFGLATTWRIRAEARSAVNRAGSGG